MSSKRRSDYQITKDPSQRSVGDDDDDDRDIPRKASAQTMAQRKVIKLNPRRNIRSQGGSTSSLALPTANPFAGISNGSESQSSDTTNSTKNPFSFLAKQQQTGNSFETSSSSVTEVDESKLKRRALNEKFADKIAQLKLTNVYSDWSGILESYFKFGKEISSSSASTVQKTSNDATPSAAFLNSGSISKPAELSFGFGSQSSSIGAQAVPSTTTSLAFNFEPENSNKKSEISSKTFSAFSNTPQFTIPSTDSASVTSKNRFALLQKDENKPKNDGPDTIMIDDSDSEKSGEEIEIKGPKFMLEKPLLTNNSPFSFTKEAAQEDTVDSGFRFKPPEKSVTNVFKFNAPPLKLAGQDEKAIEDAKPSEDKPTENNTEGSVEKSQSAASELDKPTASLSKPFTFADAATDKEQSAARSAGPFSLDNGSSGSFSFGGSSEETKDKPTAKPFNFGATSTTAKKEDNETKAIASPFSLFGNPVSNSETSDKTEKSAFSFGSSSSGPSPFNFGPTPNKTDSASQFKFGEGSTAFAFGTPSVPTNQNHTWSPDKGIKFGNAMINSSDNGTSAFEKGSSGSSAANFGGAFDSKSAVIEPNPVSTENEESEKPEAQVDLSSQGAGEENEECVYEKKAKIFELVGKEYKVLGVGPLRLLSDKSTNKTRILVRAEGSGRVILNTLLKQQVDYTTEGKNQVRLIDFKADGSPTTYMIRVKTGSDANDLKDKLEEYKKS